MDNMDVVKAIACFFQMQVSFNINALPTNNKILFFYLEAWFSTFLFNQYE